MPPDYSLAQEVMSITRLKSHSFPRPGSLKVDSQGTALNSGSSIGKGVFPGTGTLFVPGYHQSKADYFFEGRFVTLSVWFAAVYVPGNASSTHCVRGKKVITKLSNDSGRGIQVSLFLVLLCMQVLEGDLKLWTISSL